MNTITDTDKQRNKWFVIIDAIDNYIALKFWHTK